MSILLVIAASSIALAAEDPVATTSDWNKVCVSIQGNFVLFYFVFSRLVMNHYPEEQFNKSLGCSTLELHSLKSFCKMAQLRTNDEDNEIVISLASSFFQMSS